MGMDMYAALLGRASSGGGGGSGAFIVNEDAELALDKTWQEIYNALDGGNIVIIKSGDIAYRFVSSIASVHGSYMLSALGDEYGEITAYLYSAEGADAYPTLVTE